MFTRPEETSTPAKKKRANAIWGLVFIAVAIAAAIGAATLLTRYMDARVAAARVPTVKVLVAAADIPVATPIRPEWLALVDWPAAAQPEGYLADPAQAVGKAVTVAIARGEPVLPGKLVTAGARGGLAALVPAGMRAIAVRVDDVVGVAGFIHSNDRVDVIVTMQPKDQSPFISKIVLQNVQVLAVGKEIESRTTEPDKAKSVTVATLMVTSEDSERLAMAASRGQLLLTLRGLGDEELADTRGVTPPALLAGAIPEPTHVVTAVVVEKPRPKKHARPVEVATQPKREKQEVEILRGDLFEKRHFEAQEARK